ncbi:MAG: hypothetical protein ACHQDD_00140 [Steroidobacterales bacterium]
MYAGGIKDAKEAYDCARDLPADDPDFDYELFTLLRSTARGTAIAAGLRRIVVIRPAAQAPTRPAVA